MSRRIAVIGAVSAILLIILVARYDATAAAPRWSQEEAERRLRDTARNYGIDTSRWRVHTTTALKEDLLRLVRREHVSWPEVFTPFRYELRAAAPGRSSSIRADYTADGRLLRWECSSCRALLAANYTAATAIAALAGSHAREFVVKDPGETDGTWHWTWRGGAPDGVTVEAQVSLDKGRLTSAVLDVDVASRVARHLAPPGNILPAVFRGISGSMEAAALTWACCIVLFRSLRRKEARRMGFALACFWWAAALLGLVGEGVPGQPGQPLSELIRFGLFGRPLLWIIPCMAGMVLIRREQIPRWVGFLSAFERWQPARRTGVELLGGLLLAWPLALAPYLATAFGAPVWGLLSPRVAFENIPSLEALVRRAPMGGEGVLLFGFLLPLIVRWIRGRTWRSIVSVIVGLSLFGWIGSIAPAQPVLDVAAAFLFGLVSFWIYRDHGLVGVFGALLGSAMVTPLAWLLTAPLNHILPLFSSALVYGGSVAGAVWLQRLPSAGEDTDFAAEIARRNEPLAAPSLLSERELLRAGFAEAREAQMGMLPEKAPVIEGFSVAAVCIPAREVGGDLYDFLEFPDGQWGLCVADVSGKGVPAALYMTMTKGLLASEGRVATDVRELALALNEPLHQAARKKTFVTLALARLDPKTRMVEIIRAGHNPVLWRRANRNETVWLRPDGLGLGLVSNKMFGLKLERRTIELEPGDTLVLYSDGLTEAENPRVELFGDDRLLQAVEQGDGLDAAALLQSILAEVEQFKEGADPHDDLTLLVLKADAAQA